jgi:maltooligosyltrehalose synthase
VADYGIINSLSQLVLKLTCPGIPDTYQGTELWDLSLVDPDNRRPVDYSERMKMLDTTQAINELWATRENGQIKLALTEQLLKIRNRYSALFDGGDYIPLHTEGTYKDNIIAFIRSYGGEKLLVAVPLHINEVTQNHIAGDWKDTKIILPQGTDTRWKDLLTGKELNDVYPKDVFDNFPLGLLAGQ